MKSWKNGAKKLLIIQNWTFFSSTAWLPKRPILGRNRNLKGSPCLLSIYSLLLSHKNGICIFMRCGHLIWGIICYCTMACSFRILKKAGEWRLRRFVFVVIASQIGLKIHRIFQTSKDSDKTNPSTETNNTSYESPNTQLFGARRMRA